MIATLTFSCNWFYKYYMNYKRIYYQLICKRKNNVILNQYKEKHHIFPASLYPKYKKEKWNIIELTAREHFIAHALLAKIYGGKMIFAFNMMSVSSNKQNRYNSKLFEYNRIKLAKLISESRKGKKLSLKTKKKISDAYHNLSIEEKNRRKKHRIGSKASIELKKKISDGYNNLSEEKKKDMSNKRKETINNKSIAEKLKISNTLSIAMKGVNINKIKINNGKIEKMLSIEEAKVFLENDYKKGPLKTIKGLIQEKIICPHCDKKGGQGNMKRYHFENCKKR